METESLNKRLQDEKLALSNKLTFQYESMLSDQKSNNEIQIKQKMLEFERKSKNYEKRISESEKRRSELKLVIDRTRMEYQMKI